MKVHRIATHDHVVIGLLMEPLQSRKSDLDIRRHDSYLLQRHPMTTAVKSFNYSFLCIFITPCAGFHGFWLTAATRNLLDLGVRSNLSLLSQEH